jgi:hypothetical protein
VVRASLSVHTLNSKAGERTSKLHGFLLTA